MVFNNMEQLYYSVRRISDPSYEHVDNHFSPIPEKYIEEFSPKRDRIAHIICGIAELCAKGDYSELRRYDSELPALQTAFSDMRKSLTEDIRNNNLNLTVAYLYLNLLQESEQITIELQQMSRASRKFQLG